LEFSSEMPSLPGLELDGQLDLLIGALAPNRKPGSARNGEARAIRKFHYGDLGERLSRYLSTA